MTGATALEGARPSPAPSWRPRAEIILPIVAALLATGYAIWAIEPWPVGVFQDDGLYTVLAKSLATGHGYRFLNLPGEPNATHYPPLYPAFLALLWRAWPDFPSNVVLFKVANAVLTGVAAYLAFRFARARVGLGLAGATFATVAFTACAPVVLLTVMVLSEPLFLAALFPVLLVAERAAESGRDRDALAAGAAGAVLALIRTLGIVVVPATALVLAWRRRWRAAALVCASGVLVSLPWQLWVAANSHEVPRVFAGKYGSYLGWLGDAYRDGGPAWVARLVGFNLTKTAEQGWATVAVDTLPVSFRWGAIVALTLFFAAGWWQLVRRTPVSAWAMTLYLALIVSWPFMPARFTWGIWPLVGCTFALAAQALWRWRPRGTFRGARVAAMATGVLLVAGYARYNWLGTSRGWWTQVQQLSATRARPFAEWIVANTRPDDLLATDDDALIYLYTGRRTMPTGSFTAQEHLSGQTPHFAMTRLQEILRAYPVNWVVASTRYSSSAVDGLLHASPPALRVVRVMPMGAVLVPTRADPNTAR